MPCLKKLTVGINVTSVTDAKVIDGSVVVNMLSPGASKTYFKYAQEVFTPYVMTQFEHVSRLDIVWHVFIPNSLKSATWANQGQGKWQCVTPDGKIPANWVDFLENYLNKHELFQYLTQYLTNIQMPDGKQLFVTSTDTVLPNPDNGVALLALCSHKEADTRILVHVADAAQSKYSRVGICTVDTDVVVLAISLM